MTKNGYLKVLFSKFHRRTNFMELLLSIWKTGIKLRIFEFDIPSRVERNRNMQKSTREVVLKVADTH
jgi:hypothetical protein